MDAITASLRQALADGKLVGFGLSQATGPAPQDGQDPAAAGSLSQSVTKLGSGKLGATKAGLSKGM